MSDINPQVIYKNKYKYCSKCKIKKKLDCFSRSRRTLTRYKSDCNKCYIKSTKKFIGYIDGIGVKSSQIIINGKKLCYKCKVAYPIESFAYYASEMSGRSRFCNPCLRQRYDMVNYRRRIGLKVGRCKN